MNDLERAEKDFYSKRCFAMNRNLVFDIISNFFYDKSDF